MKTLIFFLSILPILLTHVSSRTRLQKIIINDHEWIVPNEPGWIDVVREADALRTKHFRNCQSIEECRGVTELLREVFLKHAVSAKYFMGETNAVDTIFKWG
ncbi:unnamed protein product [Didymodactylos carnosus]|uniref:Uncharacterized protein n=1 Tax=Didymodactylos carnosus TaxID=1234261 RepID=A0A813X445_9BILA|nr:unnamed protein product [Didymodactylos carnosus]CAF1427884.1 unnamed protein product [Didymodactylos carnosus]CAF3647588.1 unnamed protein product [Didymodactylos carnosus]CAF4226640.1 unnamed protein product [Didymodactylos carnosus]